MEEVRPIQDMWEVPYLCQFVKLFHASLNLEPFTPEELEQALQSPKESALCSELITKLLLKKSALRRELAIGEGYSFDRWHELLSKQISGWIKVVQKYQKGQSYQKFSAAHRIILRCFQDLGESPFKLDKMPSPVKLPETPPPTDLQEMQLDPCRRATRSRTNTLKNKRPRYTDYYLEHSSDPEKDEQIKSLADLQEWQRVLVVYALAVHKLETDDELLHELNYVPLSSKRVDPMGTDRRGNRYYFFDNLDCRIYSSDPQDRFRLLAKTLEQVDELTLRLEAAGDTHLADTIKEMRGKLEVNEQERSKRLLAQIRKTHTAPGRRRLLTDYEYEDSDFSPQEDDVPRKRGPGRPRKIPLPERKPKIMPTTSGDDLVLSGTIKKISASEEILHSFRGDWQLVDKQPKDFKFLKSDGAEISGLYLGFWQYYAKPVEETLHLEFRPEGELIGTGENLFGIFTITGQWSGDPEDTVSVTLRRSYVKFEITDESSCSEADQDSFDAVKPPYQLDFEERVYSEHMHMPVKSFRELKSQLRQQDKREMQRQPFYKSEYLA